MRLIDLTGMAFGRLTVESRAASNRAGGKHVAWNCRCECGGTVIVTTVHLRVGHTTSCGCYRASGVARRTHGHAVGHKRGEPVSHEYQAWTSAKRRCYQARSADYPRYGGRGITMADAWRDDFAQFYRDMGERPAGTTLDRIDTNGNYEPGNCRWATPLVQANNKRCNRLMDFAGRRMTLSDIARSAGVDYHRLWWQVVRLGLPLDDALAVVHRG